MKFAGPRLSPCRSQKASALIIVLLFLVLLTGLVVLFLSRSLTALIVSNRSAGQSKVSILANSAGDIIIGDLKQEIIDGSTSSNVATGYTVYTPKGASATSGGQSTATPALSGFTPTYTSGVESDGLANLLKVSKYGYPPYSSSTNANFSATGVSRASNVSSSTASLNGRVLTPARWNAHYLIGRQTTGSSYDSTPVSGFPTPDWIIVTRGGARTAYSAYTSTLANSAATNTDYAVGRFAYAIYNEGGMLDMNAAGYPATDAASGSVGLTSAQLARKLSAALADLTQLPVSSSNSTAVMTQAQINNLVGWRNYYTSQFTSANGSFGAFKYDSTSTGNWMTNFVAYNGTNGFMTMNTNSLTVPAPPTDQALLSRQQLINLTRAIGISPDALQYLGTFSRALEQPSFTPDPNRPKVIGTSAPPDASIVDSYQGNNDGWGGDDVINPAFLNIRVLNSFTRLDGTTAVVGEPLVKRKYALSRLSQVTYTATASKSQGDPIYARFGLSRGDNSSPWTYDHGITGSSGGVIIGTLAQVAAAGREPDFAEMLKAAITVGSLAKGGPGLHNGQGNYQYTIDSTVDYQVLQIMADLIDQYDTDSYPTVIQIASGTSMRQFYGVEDLPYFYRYHLFSVVTRLPSPLLRNTTSVTFPIVSGFTRTGSTTTATMISTGATQSESWTVSNAATVTYQGCQKASLSDAGEAVYLYVPDLWNPHDGNLRNTSAASNRPTSFRIYATTSDPLNLTPAWNTASESKLSDSSASGGGQIVPEKATDGAYIYPCSTPSALSMANNDWITFSDNGGRLFREPTLLWNSHPSLISINGTTATRATEVNTSKVYYGIPAGRGPISMQANFTSVPAQGSDGAYVFQGRSVSQQAAVPTGAYQQITFTLQYQDPNNAANWITYDVKYPDLHGMTEPSIIVNTLDYGVNTYMNPLRNNQMSANASSFDPRSARWGIGTTSNLGQFSVNGDYTLEPTAYSNFTLNTTSGNSSFGNSGFAVLETQRPRSDKGNQVNYSNPGMTSDPGKNQQMRLFSGVGFSASNGQNTSPLEYDGLMSQNNPSVSLKARDGVTNAQFYFEDADGMARRAMGAYSDPSAAIIDTSTKASPLASPSNYAVGMPLATSNTFTDFAVATPQIQSQSRPIILNRAFTSVMDMSYAFRGTPWKNIDFFTPESGDAALLDVFCVNEPPSNAIVAGKVDLNTRQLPVLQALIANTYRDEFYGLSGAPAYALSPLSNTEAKNVATKLVGITTDTSNNWRGALSSISGLVGRYVPNAASGASSATDAISYTQPSAPSGAGAASTYVYAGLAAAIDSSTYSTTLPGTVPASSLYIIQRFREAGIRPLADCGQTRVWNLLIDVVAQTGKYPPNATGLDQFAVDGEKRLWIHVAIDRYTGQILDKQVEVVTP